MPQTHKGLNIFILSGEAKLHRGFYENTFYGHLSMPQTHKRLNIFILSGEAKLHRGFYENQYDCRQPKILAEIRS
jgi:hypothetical protein